MQRPWQQTTVIARRTNITITALPRLNPRPHFLRETIRLSAPWNAVWLDTCGMALRFPQTLFFPHW
jgi:hypothetical protein